MACLPRNFIQSEVSIHATLSEDRFKRGWLTSIAAMFRNNFLAAALQIKGWKQRHLFSSIREPQNRKKISEVKFKPAVRLFLLQLDVLYL